MESFNKDLDLMVTCNTHHLDILKSLIVAIVMLLFSTTATAQPTRKLNPKVYERVVKPSTTMEVKTIKNGEVLETRNTSLNEFRIADNTKAVATYEKKISVIDDATYAKIKLNPEISGAREDFRILPELHIVNRSSATESYRIVFSLTQPFQYDPGQKTFNTTLGFFLLPESENSTTIILEPVNLEVVSNVVKTIKPDTLKITHVNLPSSKVELIAERVSDSAEVKVITASNPDGYKTYLLVEPALEIFTNRSTLQGYGVQKIPIEVRFIGSSSSDSVKVNFSIGKGSVDPTSIFVSYNTPSTIYINSEGTGAAELSAITNSLQSNKISFIYTFPWPFLLFSMVGGLIGGLTKHYFTSGVKKFPVKPIIGGILIGFIVAVAYYFLGINLIGLSLTAGVNEMAALGLSALGAYFGINVSPKPAK